MRTRRRLAVAAALLAVALTMPAKPAPCVFCHEIRCLTSKLCGRGCTCLKQGGSTEGLCVRIGD